MHRIRRRRTYFRQDSGRPQPAGVEDAIAALKSRGLSFEDVLALLGSLRIEPVFAAHSTESTRRTLLRKQQRVAQHLLDRLDPTLTPQDSRTLWSSIRIELTAAWQTEEQPRERLTVADEREQVLFYLIEILYRVVPGLLRGDRAGAREALRRSRRLASSCRPSCASAPGSAATWTATRTSTPRPFARRSPASSSMILNSYFEECQTLVATAVAERQPRSGIRGADSSASRIT